MLEYFSWFLRINVQQKLTKLGDTVKSNVRDGLGLGNSALISRVMSLYPMAPCSVKYSSFPFWLHKIAETRNLQLYFFFKINKNVAIGCPLFLRSYTIPNSLVFNHVLVFLKKNRNYAKRCAKAKQIFQFCSYIWWKRKKSALISVSVPG